MKNLILMFCSIIVLSFASFSSADDYVNGYFRSNGTYVEGYYRSSPNNTVRDNFSYKGNVNPYTGKIGTNYYQNNPTSEYYNSTPLYKSNNSFNTPQLNFNNYNWGD